MYWSSAAEDGDVERRWPCPLRRPARPACCHALRDCSRIAAQHARVQRADVDAQLQRVGGHHRVHLVPREGRAQSLAAPSADSRRDSRAPARRSPAGRAPCPSGTASAPQPPAATRAKRNGLNIHFAAACTAIRRVSCKTPLRMPSCSIDHRRIVEHEVPHAHRRAVIITPG